MGWQVEQNTGLVGDVIRFIWFKGHIYASTWNDGVWRRDGVGPWIKVHHAILTVGPVCHWEADDALWASDGPRVRRSVDGITWTLEFDVSTLGLQGAYTTCILGGDGNYLYAVCIDGGGVAYFYRYSLAGVLTAFAVPLAAGGTVQGIVSFGGVVYYTTATFVWYWTGAAWALEPTLDPYCANPNYMSVIDDVLYVESHWPPSPYSAGYFWKTPTAISWSFLPLPVPDAGWNPWTLCKGADGEIYTISESWPDTRIFRKVGNAFSLTGYDSSGLDLDVTGGVCVDDTGTMYFGSESAGVIKFFAFVPDYDLNPDGDGLLPQAMDVDGDGDILYLGLYDGAGQPVLVRVNLPLTVASMGNLMYDPGAGDAINVRCTNVGRNLVISGYFGANEQVRYSVDGGVTLTDMDPDTWAANRAQPLLVDPDTTAEVMVALDAAQDLYETEDLGTLWTQRNAAIGYTPSAAARLPDGPELVIGNGAANRIDYSPFYGVILHDITAGFIGFCQALEVV